MLSTILAWVYITTVCWSWGCLTLALLNLHAPKDKPVEFAIVCMAGLSVIAVVCGYLSLFMALGGTWPHIILVSVALLNAKRFLKPAALWRCAKQTFSNLHITSVALLLSCVVLLLVMSAWYIIHPDTVGYHAQIIQWIKTYKAVPGLVHLNARYGLQNLWFVLCAVFSFSFLQSHSFTYVNSTVLLWFIYFVVGKATVSAAGKKSYTSFLWLALLAISIGSYVQLRLTATSASPDFIAALYVWLVIYLFVNRSQSILIKNLIFLFAVVAVTIKLSALPVLLFAACIAWETLFAKKWKSLLVFICAGLFILAPLLARNIITSGYAFFPAAVANIAPVDWKYNKEGTKYTAAYVKAYARNNTITTAEETEAENKKNFSQWIPVWWQQNGLAEKAILAIAVLSILLWIFFFKRMIQTSNRETILASIISIIGIVFWFYTAPAPRFGVGFLIGFTGLNVYTLFQNFFKTPYVPKGWYIGAVVLLTIPVVAYDAYRFTVFFEWRQWLKPAGLKAVVYKNETCNGFLVHLPPPGFECAGSAVPCVDTCGAFLFRGRFMTDGFKEKP